MTLKNLFLACAIPTLMFFSCESVIQKSEKNFTTGWNIQDSLSFLSPVLQPSNLYRLKLNVTFTEDYPFRNIYFQVGIAHKDSFLQHSIARFETSDESGYWYEKSSGGKHDFEWIVLDSLTSKAPSQYQFSVKQYMRLDTLPGISSAKLMIQQL